ncbi:U-scoloptoxin(01)-Cw1a-like [Bacillus rossius redtenbacheri]|uniref:U-scoloptoxin(01)-Cw1a-like n=1 Tax=Bacillus rossius redtenbacheri TaxID=93214 RepID=UPI002FDD81FE
MTRHTSYLVVFLFGAALAYPKLRVSRQAGAEELLGLPSNATAIRADIADTFSCEQKVYGYYADVDNACQLFHVCLPVRLADGVERTFKWSFICPEETVFNQESFTCSRPEDSVACEESPQYYDLNLNFGQTAAPSVDAPGLTEPPQTL